MTKSNLINRMCAAYKLPTGRSEQIVNAIFDAIEQALNRGERVEIRGFGSFEVRNYRGYVGRNPRTGTTVEVKPKRLAFFKVGKELKDRVQRHGAARADETVEETADETEVEVALAATPSAPTAVAARKSSLVPPAKHASVGASNV